MRAKEFVIETKRGKQLDAQAKVMPMASYTLDGVVDLYRAASLMARSPADTSDIDPYSFVTKRPMILAYTDEEMKMIKDAFKRMGVSFSEYIHDQSEEPGAVNNTSPMQGFKGYPR